MPGVTPADIVVILLGFAGICVTLWYKGSFARFSKRAPIPTHVTAADLKQDSKALILKGLALVRQEAFQRQDEARADAIVQKAMAEMGGPFLETLSKPPLPPAQSTVLNAVPPPFPTA